MRSAHCRSNAFGSLRFVLLPARRSAYLLCSGYDSLHAPRGTGDATRPVKSHAGCTLPNADTQLNSWNSRRCLRPSSNSFHSWAVHITPKPLKVRVGVTTVWSTSAPNRKICKDLIRRKSGNCSNDCHFFCLILTGTLKDFILGYFYSLRGAAVYFPSSGESAVSSTCHGDLRDVFTDSWFLS